MARTLFRRLLMSLTAPAAAFVWATPLRAGLIGGIEFPQGTSSFADAVLQYNPTFTPIPKEDPPEEPKDPPDPAVPKPDPSRALGLPDDFSVPLGRGGLLELLFLDNLLTNSGNGDPDLYLFKLGPDLEDTLVALRPTAETLALLDPAGDADADGFFEVGKLLGAASSIDIDAFFPGFAAGALKFDAVQLLDDPDQGDPSGDGADIDAVGAIASAAAAPSAVPEPGSLILLVSGVPLALAAVWRQRARRRASCRTSD